MITPTHRSMTINVQTQKNLIFLILSLHFSDYNANFHVVNKENTVIIYSCFCRCTFSPSLLNMCVISRFSLNCSFAIPSKHFFKCGCTRYGSFVSDKISSISSLDKKKNLIKTFYCSTPCTENLNSNSNLKCL